MKEVYKLEPEAYLRVLHDYLWRFVRVQFPFAEGDLHDYIKTAVECAEYTKQKEEE